MTEYRVVATLDTEYMYNGEKHHRETASCWWNGCIHKMQTFDKDKAEEYLALAKKECPKFDAKTQADTSRCNIHYRQSNIRIQTREVTDWK